MKKAILILFSLLTSPIFAQITLTTQATPATCTANGVLAVTATGGVAPYSYQIIAAPLGLTRPLQSINRFEALFGGTYTVQVTDITNATATATATIIPLYTLPSLPTAVVQGSTVTITAHNGTPPYRYAYCIGNDTTFWTNGHLTSNNVFTCLLNGSYTFRTYDACGNYFPLPVTVSANGRLPRAACNVNGNSTTNITYFIPSGAITPYTFTAVSNTGITTTNSTGNFTNLTGCSFNVSYTDGCGQPYSPDNYNCAAPVRLCGKARCFNAKDGSVQLSAVGGRAPYRFSLMTNGVPSMTNTTGNFTGMPQQATLNFEITDDCGQTTWLRLESDATKTVEFKCPYDDTLHLNYDIHFTAYSPCDTLRKTIKPANLTLLNDLGAIIYNQPYATVGLKDLPFIAPVNGNYQAIFTDSCGRKDTVFFKPKGTQDAHLICMNWQNGTATWQGFGGSPPYIFSTLQATPSPTINNTGIFTNLRPNDGNIYTFKMVDQCLDTLVLNASHKMIAAKYKCPFTDSIYVRATESYFYTYSNRTGFHPYNFPITFNYFDNGVLLKTQTLTDTLVTEIRIGTVPYPSGNAFLEIVTACGGRDTISPTVQLPGLAMDYDCETITMFIPDNTSPATILYSLYFHNTLIAQNGTGIFTNIYDGGAYHGTATLNGGCLIEQDINVDSLVRPIFKIGVYSEPENGVCKQVYHLIITNGNITLKDIDNIPIAFDDNFIDLKPGDYLYRMNGCHFDTLHLPALTWNLTGMTSVHLNCNGTANLVLGGKNSIPYYLQNMQTIFGANSTATNMNFNDAYGLLGFAVNTNNGNFNGVPMGTTYHAVLIPNTFYFPASLNCPLDTVDITVPLYTRPTLTTSYAILCGASTTSDVQLTAIDGTPYFSFQLLNPPASYALPTTLTTSSRNVTFPGLPLGTYHFIMEDSCHISADFDVSVGSYGFTPNYERFCNGDVHLYLPDISNATFNWQNAAGTTISTAHETTFFSLAAATYYVTVTINNACTYTHTISVPAAACPPVFANAGPNQVNLNNVFTLAANTPTNGATGTWSQVGGLAQAIFNPINSPTATVTLPVAGTYSLVWTVNGGLCGCISTDTMSLTQCVITDTLRATLRPIPPACNSAGAQISVLPDPSANSSNWIYNWSNGAHTARITALPAGTYTVTITDGRPCTLPLILSTTVNNFSNTVINRNVSCNGGSDGSATVFVLGGIPPYTYVWNVASVAQGNSINNAPAGNYTVSITDATNCTTVVSLTITEPQAMSVAFSATAATCFHSCTGILRVDSVQNGIAPYRYHWSNGYLLPTFNGVCAGLYTVTVTDMNLCTASARVTVTEPDSLIISLAAITNANCGHPDGGATVTATGGNGNYTFYWDNTNTNATAANLTGGTHSVVVADVQGCSQRGSIFIPTNPPINATIPINTIDTVRCFGQCTGKMTATILAGGIPPFSFLWSNGDTAPTADRLCPVSNYTVTVTDLAGCTATASAFVPQISKLEIINAALKNVRCNGETNGSIAIGVTGGNANYTYFWSNNTTNDTLLNVAAGIYTVTVTDAYNCTATASYTLTQPALLGATVQILNAILCNGDQTANLNTNVQGGTMPYLYQYNTQTTPSGVSNLSAIGAGSYAVTVTDANNCATINTISISEPPPLHLSFSEIRDAGCNGTIGGHIQALAWGGTGNTAFFHYDWSIPSTNTSLLNNILGGIYTATVSDANGCTQSLSATIVNQPPPQVDSAHFYSPTCHDYADGAIRLFTNYGIPPLRYTWNPNPFGNQSDSLFSIKSGTYFITVTDDAGCFSTKRLTLSQPLPIAATIKTTAPRCYLDGSGSVEISSVQNARPPSSALFSIDGLPFDTLRIFQPISSDDHTITIKDSIGCLFQQIAHVPNGFPLFVDIGPDVFLNLGDTLHLKAVLNNYSAVSYHWQILDWGYHVLTDVQGAGITRFFNPQITSTVFANLGGYGVVTVTDSLACTATDTMFFKLQDKYEIYIPNIFTPNNDGINDFFTAYGGASAKNIHLMRIFDRWGELVYEGKDLPVGGTRPRETWNGTFKEQALNTAVFSYYIEIGFIDNTTQRYTGDVTLLR